MKRYFFRLNIVSDKGITISNPAEVILRQESYVLMDKNVFLNTAERPKYSKKSF
jgi:hypothetical protein